MEAELKWTKLKQKAMYPIKINITLCPIEEITVNLPVSRDYFKNINKISRYMSYCTYSKTEESLYPNNCFEAYCSGGCTKLQHL